MNKTMMYVCIPVKDEKEGIEVAEKMFGDLSWKQGKIAAKCSYPADYADPIYITEENPMLSLFGNGMMKLLEECEAKTTLDLQNMSWGVKAT